VAKLQKYRVLSQLNALVRCNVVSQYKRVFESPKIDKCVWRPGSAQIRSGSFNAPPDLLTAIGGGVLLLKGKWGRERAGKRKGKEKGEGEGRGKRDMEGETRLPPLYSTSGYVPDNNNHDNVYGAVITIKVIVTVHPVHLMNAD